MVPRLQTPFVAANAKLGTCRERGTEQLTLPISFCARAAMLAVIDFCVPSAQESAGLGEEHVHPLTPRQNSDADMTVAFAHKLLNATLFNEPLKAIREVKRSAMSGEQSAPSLDR